MESKAMAKLEKEAHALANPLLGQSWGAEEVEATDISIPRALLMQGLSDLVGDKKAQAGDIIESLFYTKLADEKTELEIVPIYIYKDWRKEKLVSGKYEFDSLHPYTLENANWPREYKEGKEDFKNSLGINVLAMLAKDLDNPAALPIVVTFRVTSMGAGKQVSTIATQAKMIGKAAAHFTIRLTSEYTKNDKGQFYVWRVKGAKETADYATHESRLKSWYDTFKSGKAKVEDEKAVEETAPEVVTNKY